MNYSNQMVTQTVNIHLLLLPCFSQCVHMHDCMCKFMGVSGHMHIHVSVEAGTTTLGGTLILRNAVHLLWDRVSHWPETHQVG